jgi:hypothetical protein
MLPVLFHRISDAAALRARQAREPQAHIDHLRESLQEALVLMSPRQLRALEVVPSVKELLDSAAPLED